MLSESMFCHSIIMNVSLSQNTRPGYEQYGSVRIWPICCIIIEWNMATWQIMKRGNQQIITSYHTVQRRREKNNLKFKPSLYYSHEWTPRRTTHNAIYQHKTTNSKKAQILNELVGVRIIYTQINLQYLSQCHCLLLS